VIDSEGMRIFLKFILIKLRMSNIYIIRARPQVR
jgi:hypothetical protein